MAEHDAPTKVTSRPFSGFVWLVVVGSLLHFVFEWSGRSVVVGMLAPVNESVWEHLKLGYTALILFVSLNYGRTDSSKRPSYLLANAIGVLAMNAFIVAFFYGYTSLTHRSILALDISSFVVAAGVCQLVAHRIQKKAKITRSSYLGVGLLIFMGLLFIAFTFSPPHLPVFRDPLSGGYGI